MKTLTDPFVAQTSTPHRWHVSHRNISGEPRAVHPTRGIDDLGASVAAYVLRFAHSTSPLQRADLDREQRETHRTLRRYAKQLEALMSASSSPTAQAVTRRMRAILRDEGRSRVQRAQALTQLRRQQPDPNMCFEQDVLMPAVWSCQRAQQALHRHRARLVAQASAAAAQVEELDGAGSVKAIQARRAALVVERFVDRAFALSLLRLEDYVAVATRALH